MNTAYINGIFEYGPADSFPKNVPVFVIGVKQFDRDTDEDGYDDDYYITPSLEKLVNDCPAIKIVKRFPETYNGNYLGSNRNKHILQPALIMRECK